MSRASVQIVGRLEAESDAGDSVLDAGTIVSRAAALQHAGADVLELALQSRHLDEPEALCHIVRRLHQQRLEVAIRVPDAPGALQAINAGAGIVNCLGDSMTTDVRRLAATRGTVLVVNAHADMRTHGPENGCDGLLAEINDRISACVRDGMQCAQVIVGIGEERGTQESESLLALRCLPEMVASGYRIMVDVDDASSSMGLQGPRDAALIGQRAGLATWAVQQGAQFVRSRDVQTAWRAVTMIEAVLNPEWEPASC